MNIPKHEQVLAGHRAIIKRAIRLHNRCTLTASDTDTDTLNAWAVANPAPLAEIIQCHYRAMKKEYEAANDSGNPKTLEHVGDRREIEHDQAQRVLSLFGVKSRLSALLPDFIHGNGRVYRFDELAECLGS